MQHYYHRAQAALEPFGVELNDPQEEMPEKYAMAFGPVNEALEKMPCHWRRSHGWNPGSRR
ncbi:hypothetical protein E2562_035249 [Oryza meyeriana var. granulata]|uniref:Uncharacterized protein n=1 Tax=Oryza meyeriana var. granulata TaxID=110450 RepID=A0A6G1CJZ6_9ORYZ|nr:hypothetical protein E2562_035249 [Oryza meyeriana var. granulata]